jgi:mitotic spindle assembly checkpoint protein MAD2B
MNDSRLASSSSSSSSSRIDSERFVSIFTEFIECAVHCILKSRKIYPDVLFEKRMKYGVSIWRCRHPAVSEYIEKVMKNCVELIRLVRLEKISLVYLISLPFL